MSEERYKQRKQRQKERFMAQVAAAQENRGIAIIYTGNGRGEPPQQWERLHEHWVMD